MRTFEITFPNIHWKKLFLFCVAVGMGFGAVYWVRNVYSFFTIDQAVLCVSSTEVRCEETGRLSECSLDEGDCFQQGQSLFSLDRTSFVNQLKEMSRKIELNCQQLDQGKQEIDQSMEQYLYLQKEMNLQGKSSEFLDQILGEAQKMQEQCSHIEKEIALLKKERAELEKLIEKGSFSAKSDGVILRRFKQLGEAVFNGEPVFLISNSQQRWVEAEIEEKMLLKIRIGSPALVSFPSFPQKTWPAKVSWISSVVKEGKLKIRIAAENLPPYSGLTAKASIKYATTP